MGLLKDLFNKSGDELKKIEEAKKPPVKKTPEQIEKDRLEAEKDRLLRLRIRELRIKEGRDPDTGKLAGSQSFIKYAKRS